MPEGMDDLPYVQRDDESDLYADDIEAAIAVSKITGTPVMFVMDEDAGIDADTGEPIPIKRNEWHHHLRPFVLPRLTDLAVANPNFDFWCHSAQHVLREKGI